MDHVLLTEIVRQIFNEVATARPDIFEKILHIIKPHSIESVHRIFRDHLQLSVQDLSIFNRHRERIPHFMLKFVQVLRRNFPTPGDAFGIQLTCRITKNDTQGTLDSKHLGGGGESGDVYNVEKPLQYEIDIFSSQTQVFEMATRRKYSTLYVRHYTIDELLGCVPNSGYLELGGPCNKAKSVHGVWEYLNTYRFILVRDPRNYIKVIYKSANDLNFLTKQLDSTRILAFSDVRIVFKLCGIVCYFLNMCEIVQMQLFESDHPAVLSTHERDIVTVLKYQCRSGTPLAMNRNGLAKNQERTPIEVLSFEAPKKNYARLAAKPGDVEQIGVDTSADKIFFGQQFNEGTGYKFAVIPQEFYTP